MPTPAVVLRERRHPLRWEYPCIRLGIDLHVQPLADPTGQPVTEGGPPLRLECFGCAHFAPVDPLLNIGIVSIEPCPGQSEDLPRTHPGEDGEAPDEAFPKVQDRKEDPNLIESQVRL